MSYKTYALGLAAFLCFCVQFLSADSIPSNNQQEENRLLDQTLNFARGHQEFRDLYFKQHEQEFVRLVQEGQSPKTLFIGCSDSRIVPDLLLGTRPGDLFVIRTAGNFVPPYKPDLDDGVSATIEYAVQVLGVKHIIVCGHSHCGAIEGLFKDLEGDQFSILRRWLRFGKQAKAMTLLTIQPGTSDEAKYNIAEHISVIYQLEHLLTYPFIEERIKNKTLELHGWHIEIETGEISFYDPETYSFKALIAANLRKFNPQISAIEERVNRLRLTKQQRF